MSPLANKSVINYPAIEPTSVFWIERLEELHIEISHDIIALGYKFRRIRDLLKMNSKYAVQREGKTNPRQTFKEIQAT